jgi:hypothetical protein
LAKHAFPVVMVRYINSTSSSWRCNLKTLLKIVNIREPAYLPAAKNRAHGKHSQGSRPWAPGVGSWQKGNTQHVLDFTVILGSILSAKTSPTVQQTCLHSRQACPSRLSWAGCRLTANSPLCRELDLCSLQTTLCAISSFAAHSKGCQKIDPFHSKLFFELIGHLLKAYVRFWHNFNSLC